MTYVNIFCRINLQAFNIIFKEVFKINPVKVIPTRELVASKLRKAIFSGRFKAGEELTQSEIANMLGVSRMPVREAIQTLTEEGLLKKSPNKSAVVSELSDNYINDHYEVRILLECKALEKAIKNSKNANELKKINMEYENAILNNDMDKAKILNENFHITIWELANNKKLKNLLLQLWNGLSHISISHNVPFEEHQEIIDAFSNKDIEKAKKAMKNHLLNSMNNILENINLK